MRVVVPYAERAPKTRLAPVLDPAERTAFARRMLADVLDAIRATGRDPEVLTPDPLDESVQSVPAIVDERPLSPAINALLDAADEPVAVVMADLALATERALSGLFETAGDVVVAPGRAGGTNAIVVRDRSFRVDYHGASYLDHRAAARDRGLTITEVDSHRLASDVDEPGDLVEVLVHGRPEGRETRAFRWLADRGFSLRTDGGRVEIERTDRERS